MNEEADSSDMSLPLPALERIEKVCLRFEAAWKQGDDPRIEEYLGAAQGPERSELLRELLLLDVDYRSRSDEQPTADEYQARFPQDSNLVSDVFEELSTGAAVTETSPSPCATIFREQTLPCQFGDYELLEVLGEGGMGVVHRARQGTPDRIVALKIIRPDRLAVIASEQREKVIERFRAETQAAASLEHANIVPVYQVGQIHSQPFFSMRYIQGRGLDEVVRDGPLTGRDAAAVLEPVARALHYSHEHGIVHRDIKSRNILLDIEGKPYIADFGLAKSFAATQDLTQTAEAIGTPAYMSPEQALGAAGVDRRTDIYSLGATLYELITGRPPFRAATVAETQRQVVENEPVPPRQLNPAIDLDVATICLKCLDKEPDRRYATAEDLADDLRRFVEGHAIAARPISRAARAWRWCKRNRALTTLGGAAASLLLILAVGGPIVAITQVSLRQTADQLVTDLESSVKKEKESAQAATNQAWIATKAKLAAEESERRTRRTLYVADMKRVQRYWEESNIRVVRELLSRYLPREDEEGEDLRAFEWYYWWQQCHQHSLLLKHDGAVQLVAISSDGQQVASGCVGGKITIWDAKQGKLEHTFQFEDRHLASLAFSGDGKILAVAGAHGDVQMWNLETRETIYRCGLGVSFSFEVRGPACFDADCTRFARSCYSTGRVSLHDRLAPDQKGVALKDGMEGFFLFPREKVLGGTYKGMLWTGQPPSMSSKTWSLADENVPPPREYGGPAFCMAFSHDGSQLAVGGREGKVKVWDPANGEVTASRSGYEGIEGIIWAVAFSSDGKTLASTGADGRLVLWNVETGLGESSFQMHQAVVYAVLFLEDDSTLATAGVQGTIKLWDAATGTLKRTFKGHESSINCLACSTDGRTLVSASDDQTVRVWSLDTERQAERIEIPCDLVLGAAFDHDGKCLATAVRNHPRKLVPNLPQTHVDEDILLWDWRRSEKLATLSVGMPYLDAMLLPVFSLDDRLLVAGADRWSFDRRGPPYRMSWGQWHVGRNKILGPATFSPDNEILARPGIMEATVELWTISNPHDPCGLEDLTTFNCGTNFCLSVCFSSDGSRLFAAADNTIQVWDMTTCQRVHVLEGHTDLIRCVVNSPHGDELISASSDGTVKIWDTKSFAEKTTLKGHFGGVSCVAVSPKDNTVASAGRDATVKLWDLASGEEKATLRGHAGWVTSVCFSPDGKVLASTSEDGSVRLWVGAAEELVTSSSTQSR